MRKFLFSLLIALYLSACSTTHNPNDPYEAINRKVFVFNMVLDHYVVRPVAVGYTYIPEPIRYAISNFYNNLRDVVTLANDILQLDGEDAMQNTMRIGLNSTFGILGLIDVSSAMGLPQKQTTFGMTMKRWGWHNSSYLVFPFLGPGTVRDDLGIIPDVYFNPLFYIINDPWLSWGIFTVNLIDLRSQVLGEDKLLMSSLDPYATIRDIYLQRRGDYIYPEDDSESTSSENIDYLIDDENGESHTQRNPASAIDNLIDEENQQLITEPSAPLPGGFAIDRKINAST